jgi:hypothetical protein
MDPVKDRFAVSGQALSHVDWMINVEAGDAKKICRS